MPTCVPQPPSHAASPVATGSTACSQTTAGTALVAYAFQTLRGLPLWPLWEAYFASCNPGTAAVVAHTQGSERSRVILQHQLATFGGVLIAPNRTIRSNPRFSFDMLKISFALARTASLARGLDGCPPQWIQLLSESDAPTASCEHFHAHLTRFPVLTSHLTRRGPIQTEKDGIAAEFAPYTEFEQWTALALPHALMLASRAQAIRTKWEAAVSWKGQPSLRVGLNRSLRAGVYDENVVYTELAQHGCRIALPGPTLVSWACSIYPWRVGCCNDTAGMCEYPQVPSGEDASHPAELRTDVQALRFCRRSRALGRFFVRKVASSAVIGIARCAGLSIARKNSSEGQSISNLNRAGTR